MSPGAENGARDDSAVDRADDQADDQAADRPDADRTLTFTEAAYEAVLMHARTGAPEEVCGVLGGSRDDPAGESRVRSVHRTANVAERPRTTYRIDPAEQYDAMRDVEARGAEIVGFYHSHPTGPTHPSATDRDRATWRGYSYVIVALTDDEPSVGSWRWTGEAFEPESVVVA